MISPSAPAVTCTSFNLMELTLFDFRSLGLLTNTKQSITHKQSRDPPFSLATIRPLKPFQSNIPQTNPTLCATNPPSLSSYHLTFLLSRSTFHSDWTLLYSTVLTGQYLYHV
ncbi:hypothetical protein PCANC_05846 [Puccinia coronata f. sp. avenae]|uniref:Uncharacterized protein n=1 Tax=Puccinia coronata f. sp. avenae TaxID=200324 RepID=A0A2N5VHK4_9BASI|nr:hypothetical protein PCANC_12993 [Puccinia coronata f. sp. avenae]PLW47381.1 hypothetical protein PCANC_05846 [Puccinia coronata f. sp. avenae]PLW49481.1 hypothetical protein PCASD_01941 [Puccinia coronata f. sp. avenae]